MHHLANHVYVKNTIGENIQNTSVSNINWLEQDRIVKIPFFVTVIYISASIKTPNLKPTEYVTRHPPQLTSS